MTLRTSRRACAKCGRGTIHLIDVKARCIECLTLRIADVDPGCCHQCGEPVGDNVNPDFCNQYCQEKWAVDRTNRPGEVLDNQPVTGWQTAERIRNIEEAA